MDTCCFLWKFERNEPSSLLFMIQLLLNIYFTNDDCRHTSIQAGVNLNWKTPHSRRFLTTASRQSVITLLISWSFIRLSCILDDRNLQNIQSGQVAGPVSITHRPLHIDLLISVWYSDDRRCKKGEKRGYDVKTLRTDQFLCGWRVVRQQKGCSCIRRRLA